MEHANQQDTYLTNVSENHKSKSTMIISREPYMEMGLHVFDIIGTDEEKQWSAVCGKYRVTPYFESKEEVTNYLDAKPYLLIMSLVNLVLALQQDLDQSTKKELSTPVEN